MFEIAFIKARMHTTQGIEGYALAWRYPYRVGCQSVTTAFALGYNPRYCADGCQPTAPNPYYAAGAGKPQRDFQLYPSMMLAAESLANARALIDRGVRSDGLAPRGRAYLVITQEAARNTRAPLSPAVQTALGQRIPVSIERSAGIRDRHDVLFYFTGTLQVPYLETLGFLPGAIADHLTACGGDFRASDQMSALRWLEAGATASYGTVLEPCNFPQKFPSPGLLMAAYLAGDTALEAYWKSVAWPGQGVFVGEALARPYGPPPVPLEPR
ncbi:MAG: TIGR03790 family protein [Gammaproteobacteria bacterium]|nr:TIGR03790 family protein [Gammaproteobacteria bacterium]